MKISIEYEASWRNSFLDGDNNNPLPKGGREYLGSMTTLKKENNFIQRKVTIDTVMGLLNRLIGDQRKLYQTRAKQGSHSYFFEDIESKVSFEDKSSLTNEIVYVRNMNGSEDQNSFTGMIKGDDPIFNSDYSPELWGVLGLDFESLCNFIIKPRAISDRISLDPITIISKLEELDELKAVSNDDAVNAALIELNKQFVDAEYLDKKGMIKPVMFYCASLYLQLNKLAERYDVSSAKTKAGGLSGISKRGFTKKDFMVRYTTGRKKMLWGNPYMKKEKIKGMGEVISMLTKASGQIEITIDVEKEKAQEIETLIENAGVSAFYLGKKGLAYVSKIRI
jgi:Cas5fv helical domain